MLAFYHLGRDISFDTKPADQIQKAVLIKLALMSYDKTSIETVEIPIESEDSLLSVIQKRSGGNVFNQSCVVYSADIAFCFEPHCNERYGRTVIATLSHPNQCVISSCSDDDKALIHSCLKRWNLFYGTPDYPKPPATEVTKEAVHLACQIAESPSKVVAHSVLPMLGDAAKTLMSLKAFSEGFKMKYLSIYVDGHFIRLSLNEEGCFGYQNEKHKWINVPQEELIHYRFDINWLIALIRRDLSISGNIVPEVIIHDRLWYLGQVSLEEGENAPLFFARRLLYPSEWQESYTAFQEHFSLKKGLVLTTSPALPTGYSLSGEQVIVSLQDGFVLGSEQFHIDLPYLKNKLNMTSKSPTTAMEPVFFSEDYRYVKSKHGEYHFTKSQAAIVRELHRRKGKVHKGLLLRAVHSKQTDVNEIFRQAGKYHEALKRLIKFENGFYWLDY